MNKLDPGAAHGLTRENMMAALPKALREDPSMVALADAIAGVLDARREEIDRLRIYPEIDRLDEQLLDILAYDFKVDWWDTNYSLKVKRRTLKDSWRVHKMLGTAWAVKSVLNSLYPNSELEEWFSYDGTPECFRLNVNVSGSAETEAVEVYSTAEILRRIATVKRLSAHLEGVSYMVRNAITVGHHVDCWQYRVPECNTLRCGTWWTRHTLGWSERRQLTTGKRVDSFNICPELSGTLPYIKTPGYSLHKRLRITGQAAGYPAQPQFAGLIRSGTEWLRRALGWSKQSGALIEGVRPEGFTIAPELAGTLPEAAVAGYAVTGQLSTRAVTEGQKIKPEFTGTLPEEAQHGERED